MKILATTFLLLSFSPTLAAPLAECGNYDAACQHAIVDRSATELQTTLNQALAANPAPEWSYRLSLAEQAWEISRDSDCVGLVSMMFDRVTAQSETASCMVSRNAMRVKQLNGVIKTFDQGARNPY